MENPKGFLCFVCHKKTISKNRRPANEEDFEYFNRSVEYLQQNSVICTSCRLQVYKKKREYEGEPSTSSSVSGCSISKRKLFSSPERNPSSGTEDSGAYAPSHHSSSFKSPKLITVPIPSTSASHRACSFCSDDKDLKTMSTYVRAQTFMRTGVIVPEGARCCSKHLVADTLIEDVTEVRVHDSSSNFNRTELVCLLQEVRNQTTKKGLCFESMSDEDCLNLTGLTMQQFNQLKTVISSAIRSTRNRSVTVALALLMKLRLGLSVRVLGSIFQLQPIIVSRAIHSARKAVVNLFVPNHLGCNHITRDNFLQFHTRRLSQRLFADDNTGVAVLVVDGTYIYIEKSGNYNFQRRSFSMHKHRPLVKPMMIVGTDGYILTVLGPYLADSKNSDACITEHVMKNNVDEIRNWLKKDDVFVVDRGFRDSLDLLHDFGFATAMPHFLPKGQKQHTTEEANDSRMVTKIRWVVEAANGRIKQWESLAHTIPNSQIPYIGDYVRIVCALCNAFKPPLVKDTSTDDEIASKFLQLLHKSNDMQERVEKERWDRKSKDFVKMDGTVIQDFPKLTLDELADITLGVYQIKQASSYTQEHFSDDGQYEISVAKEEDGILVAKLQSRHTSSKSYKLWLSYNSTNILSWYCQCRSGARTVGCCAHIASIMWYLGHARHLGEVRGPAFGIETKLFDAADIDSDVDNDWGVEDDSADE